MNEPVGPRVDERYAFIWRENALQPLDGGRISPDPNDVFSRAPYFATFRSGNFDFTVITMHSIWGDSKDDRRAEAVILDDVYRAVQSADADEQDVIVLGDFNLPPEDRTLGTSHRLTPLFTGNRYTSIAENAESLYDNFWFDPEHVGEYTGANGIDAFDVMVFGNDDRAASLAVSDHRPVWARFRTDGPDDDASNGPAMIPQAYWDRLKARVRTETASPEGVETSLININTATIEQSDTLPGVGPVIAKRIVAERPFDNADDLIRVKGIGPKRLAKIKPLVRVQ